MRCCSPIGHNSTKPFCAQSGTSILLTVWKWSGESRYPGAFPPLLENFCRAFSPGPTDRPWVSEDGACGAGGPRLRVVAICPQDSRASETRARVKITPREKGETRLGRKKKSFFSLPAESRLFSRGVIFTRARVSLALLSLRENGDYS